MDIPAVNSKKWPKLKSGQATDGRFLRRPGLLLGMVVFLLAATPTLADELLRLRADLDGDGRPETLRIISAPAQQAWRSTALVKVGRARYAAKYFSEDGDIPEIRLIAIDRKRPQRQLLITTPEPGTCVYHVLSYVNGTLVCLLRFDSGPSCLSPRPLGNGLLGVMSWQGFWAKEDRFRLSADGKTLSAEPTTLYAIDIAGLAGKPLPLDGAECPTRTVPAGSYVKVKSYDAESKRYRIESANGACGWLPASELESDNELVKGLPWAG
jgi:hypothetical protein